jgi:hypothetical protein
VRLTQAARTDGSKRCSPDPLSGFYRQGCVGTGPAASPKTVEGYLRERMGRSVGVHGRQRADAGFSDHGLALERDPT